MKVAIGYKLQQGPWGGGNRFVNSLINALTARGDQVVHNLDDDDIDIILMIDPRSRLDLFTFAGGEILRYLTFKNPNAIAIHRINECDQRKKTKTMNFRLRTANYAADHTVFVGSWLKDLSVWTADDHRDNSVILNGADETIFNDQGYQAWDGDSPLKLVTHHWGGNWMKGFDVYQQIDEMLGTEQWKDRIQFDYIGNVPKGFTFRNARLLEPQDAQHLNNTLSSYHVYVTASMNEPGGNHQNEGALCGLPLIYRGSGCMDEYCKGFGEVFNGPDDFAGALEKMMSNYPVHQANIKFYPHTASTMVQRYLQLFDELSEMRSAIVKHRQLWRNPLTYALNQILR
ncbi:MAG: hypothetical protein OQK24_01350 [Magnetovibrio sp.]|nr:hypothetical protein [Magnetovibrio sp.]